MVLLIIVSIMSVLLNTDHDSFVGCLTWAEALSYINLSGRATKQVGESNKSAVFWSCTLRAGGGGWLQSTSIWKIIFFMGLAGRLKDR